MMSKTYSVVITLVALTITAFSPLKAQTTADRYTPVWELEPAGTNSTIIMRVKKVDDNNVSYYFEALTTGAHSSGWQGNNTFTDVNLKSGTNYSYRVKIKTSKGVESGWSVTKSSSLVNTATAQPGGFTYNWAKYNGSDGNMYGLGPVINPVQSFDGVRLIKHAPPAGQHPRLFFDAGDIPEIQSRLNSTASGQTVSKFIHAYTTLFVMGGAAYNKNAAYAKNSIGQPYIINVGLWDRKPQFDKLSAEDNSFNLMKETSDGRLSSMCLYLALECLIYKDQKHAELDVPYSVLAAKLAKAVTFWAQTALNDPTVNAKTYVRGGGSSMALTYDLLYWAMTDAQRSTVRKLLAKITPDLPRYGTNVVSYATTSNWAALNSFEIIPNMAIDGEEGYKPLLTEAWCRVIRNNLVYGWYKTGAPLEDIAKGQLFVTTMIILARNGYSLLGIENLKSYGNKFLPAMTQPFGYSFVGTDFLGGTGNINRTTSQPYGNFRFSSTDVIGLKWIYPNDKGVDFVWRNFIEKDIVTTNSTGYYYHNIASSPSYNDNLFLAAIFASDYKPGDMEQQAATALGSTDYIDDVGGFMTLRSGFSKDALSCLFHCRQDIGGHTFADRNSISFSGLGRIWLQRIASNSDSVLLTKNQSCILINNQGIPITNKDGGKARQPGKILSWKPGSKLSEASGDATYAYSWEWLWEPKIDSFKKSGWTPVTETPNDFQFVKKSGPENSWYNIPYYNFPFWDAKGSSIGALERIVKRLAPGVTAPMKKVYRTVAMSKGNIPFLLIADDVQKDNQVNNYKWLGQIAQDLVIESTAVKLEDSNYKCDIILKESSGNRRLLVRVLNNAGYITKNGPGYMGVNTLGQNNLVIESNSVDPKFKIMLFPFKAGDELPVTKWVKKGTLLQVVSSKGSELIEFKTDAIGRTNITHL